MRSFVYSRILDWPSCHLCLTACHCSSLVSARLSLVSACSSLVLGISTYLTILVTTGHESFLLQHTPGCSISRKVLMWHERCGFLSCHAAAVQLSHVMCFLVYDVRFELGHWSYQVTLPLFVWSHWMLLFPPLALVLTIPCHGAAG